MNYISARLLRLLPRPIKQLLEHTGYWNKYTAELSFQTIWAKEFENDPGIKDKVLEYWRKYRYLEEIKKICKFKDKTKVLDVGCGISSVLHFIKGKKHGIDPLANEYKKNYSYPQDIKIQKGFSEELPFEDQFFDVVFCSNVLDHVSDTRATIDEIFRILTPNGYLVLTVEVFKKKVDRKTPAHPYCLTKKDVHSLLKDRFEVRFERLSPWIGVRAYTKGSRKSHNKELVLILKKK